MVAISAGESSRASALADLHWTAQDPFRSALRAGPGAIRAAFLRGALAFRERIFWPLADRAATMGAPARAVCFGAVVLIAAGAGVGALVWAAPDRPGSPAVTSVAAETAKPLAAAKTAPATPRGPILHGAAPVFKPAATGRASDVAAARPIETASTQPSSSASSGPASASASADAASTSDAKAGAKSQPAPGPPAGPAAISVARDFAGAFVLYETGHTDSSVRKAFGESATPELSRALMRRPPSLPATVTVPRAKVLNVVAAPSHGRVYPVSVSLLRVGVTSELRLEMERLKDKSWQVTNVLG